MTCYFRHLHEIFQTTGTEVTDTNKQEIDKVIHGIVGVKYKNCSATWKEVKKRIAENKESFVSDLKQEWKEHK